MLNANYENYELLICLQIGDIQFFKYSYMLLTIVFLLWLFSLYLGTNRDEQMEMTSESNGKTQSRSKQ